MTAGQGAWVALVAPAGQGWHRQGLGGTWVAPAGQGVWVAPAGQGAHKCSPSKEQTNHQPCEMRKLTQDMTT